MTSFIFKEKKPILTVHDHSVSPDRRDFLRSSILGFLGSGSLARFGSAIVLGSGIASFTACAPPPKREGKKLVCTSFFLLENLAKIIAGDQFEIRCVMPVGADVHSWEPSPKKIMEMLQADAFLFNGAGLETWTGKVIPQLQKRNIPIFEAAKCVTLGGTHLCGHDHAHETHAHENCGHDHACGAGADPHIWLSVRNVKRILEYLAAFFIRLDPARKSKFLANLAAGAAECDALDTEFQAVTSRLENRKIVVTHGAFWYLCRDYGLEQISLEGYSPYSDPSPAQMVKIIDFIRQNQLKVIYATASESTKGAEAAARETGVRLAILHPLGTLSQAQIDSGADYFSVMRENLKALEND